MFVDSSKFASLRTHVNRLLQQVAQLKQQRPVVQVLNAVTQKNFKVVYDLAYGDDIRQKLDIYSPLDASPEQHPQNQLRPVILFVHGGTWQRGDKNQYLFVGESFTRAGYVVAVMNYRLAPQHVYPDYVQDVALALKYLTQYVQAHGGDPQQLVLLGHSAGAFNVVAAVNDARFLDAVHVPVSLVKAVVGIAGPYSFAIKEHPDSIPAFAENANPDEVMADRRMRPDAPPHLLMIASQDDLVEHGNTLRLAKALRAQKVPIQIHMITGTNHISIMACVASRLAWYKPTRKVVLKYLQSVLVGYQTPSP